ncbi:beta-L-arabinofuranosidase domain-containing protein [Cellulomonas rhizosphaerae]|uniref:LamG-like jellyroll fold domain-containing protein n=1 Tax=Cellulomonas rhizosphaerae TaxID=2293719 RepID=A0A413RKM0_9CELL|nr:beta-L-arabinofuranosidase domain-containing protein [Cellulomonas rhizosphaerae]RHA39934.1 hypothetical protein D1825_10970 [Cellulomonas rhizosphaerae]
MTTHTRRALRRLVAIAAAVPMVAVGLVSPAGAATPSALGDPVLDLPFEGSLADASPLAHAVVAKGVGTYEFVEGVTAGSQALRLQGATYLDLGTSTALQPQDLTLSFWIKPTSWSGEQVITWNKAAWNSDGWYVASESDASPLVLSIGPASGQPYMVAATSTSRAQLMPVDEWTNITLTYDHASKDVKFYRNGLAIGTTVRYPVGGAATGVLGSSPTLPKTIGFNGPLYNGSYLAAALDQYEVFDDVANLADVTSLYEAGGRTIDRQAIAQADADALSVPESVSIGVVLPTTGSQGSDVLWESSDPDVLSTTGVVHQPAEGEPDAHVTLTARVRYLDGSPVTREFAVTVPASTTANLLRDSGLASVQLSDDYLRNASAKEQAYLLSLSSEKFLFEFYKVAGLTPTTTSGYGGWERSDTTNFRGHAFGHYLSALSQAYSGASDETTKAALLAQVEDAVEGLTTVQDAYASAHPASAGYVSAFRESILDKVQGTGSSDENVLVPWYILHKILAGLLDIHQYVGGATGDHALDVAEQLGEYVYRRVSALPNRTTLLSTEYGGMNDALYNLYDVTDNVHFKSAAEAFDETTLFRQLAAGTDVLSGKHANTTIPKLIGALKRYTVLTKSPERMASLTAQEVADLPMYRQAAENFWTIVVDHHTYVTGANSQAEHFHDPDSLYEFAAEQGDTGDAQTAETCNEYNMLKLSRELFKLTKDVKYANYYENTFINTVLGSQDPDTGMTTYFQPMGSGFERVYSLPFTEFWCCTGTGMENFSKLGDSMYFTDRGDVYVTLFFSSSFEYADRNLRLTQVAHLPNDDTVRFTVAAIDGGAVADHTTVRLRIPDWVAADPVVTLNGEVVEPTVSGGFVVLPDVAAGDEISYRLPMEVRVTATPDNASYVAFSYGAYVLSTGLGTKNLGATTSVGVAVRVSQRDDTAQDVITVPDAEAWLDGLAENAVRIEDSADGQVQVALRHTLDAQDMVFTPHYARHGERYGLYLNIEGPDSAEAQARIKRAKESLRDGEMSIDSITNFDANNFEADKGLKTGGTSGVGTWNGRQYRDAAGGGWFSYDLAIDPTAAHNYLRAMYYSGDSGRTFDVYVNDELLKTVQINNGAGTNVFYLDTKELPAKYLTIDDSTRWKKDVHGDLVLDAQGHKIPVVTVRFQSTGGLVGGVYGVYLTRSTEYDDVATLSGLSFDAGTLVPAFSPGVASYTLTVPTSTDAVELTATPHTGSGLVYVDGVLVDDTRPRSVPLVGSTTTIALRSWAQDHSTSTPYTVTVVRADPPVLSSDATLRTIGVDGKALVGFAPTTHAYTVGTASGSAAITAVANHAAARVTVSARSAAGVYTITVTAQDGSTATYAVTVTKAAVPPVSASASVAVRSSVAYGGAHVATVKVAGSKPATGTVTVTVRRGSTVVQTARAALAGSSAKVTIKRLPVGTYTVQAVYGGSATVTGSSSARATTKVVKVGATATTTLSRSSVTAKSSSAKGRTVVTVKVATATKVTATGKVRIRVVAGSKVVRTVTVTLTRGVATATVSKLPKRGTYAVRATYLGSSDVSADAAPSRTLRAV